MEPLRYRAWKRIVQRLTAHRTPTQLGRLEAIDWDVLVVLDSCRHDVLSEVADWPIDAAITPETSTGQWLPEVSESGIFEGVHVASANGQYARADVGAASIEPLWESAWDADLGNAPPEPVFDAIEEYLADGNTPVVGHTLPPHAPYIGTLDGKWFPLQPELDIQGRRTDAEDDIDMSWQEAMARGRVPLEDARRAYRAAVKGVWDALVPYLSRWLQDGREVVVTADHGELFGGRRDWWLYEHPGGCFIDPLCKVPFVHFPTDWRSGPPPSSVSEHLRALGYRE